MKRVYDTMSQSNSNSNSNSNAITVAYWSIRGLAAPLRMMVLASGVSLNNVMYDLKMTKNEQNEVNYQFDEWMTEKPILKEKYPLINLPYVIYNGRVISQSNACFAYLGEKLGFWGKNEDDKISCNEYLCEVMDLRNKVIEFSYKSPTECSSTYSKFITNNTGSNTSIAKLNLALSKKEQNENLFLISNYPTAPDFHLFEMISQLKQLCKTFNVPDFFIENFHSLEFFYNNFLKLPMNKKYLESKLYTDLPINQKMAGFGASIDGTPWVAGTEYNFHKLTGIF